MAKLNRTPKDRKEEIEEAKAETKPTGELEQGRNPNDKPVKEPLGGGVR